MNKFAKGAFIGVGALILSTVAIGASDALQNVGGGLAGLVINSETGPCSEHATQLSFGSHAICVDQYEASPGPNCPSQVASSDVHTSENLASASCQPVSEPERQPWRFISLTEAQQLCARAGKRLPSNLEWYRAVSGSTELESCSIDTSSGGPSDTGEAQCVSPANVHDLVGNVWEWVETEVVDGQHRDRELPPSGYVSEVDSEGVAIVTGMQPSADFGEDYFWSNASGVRGVIRGGYYSSGNDAGIYSVNAAVAPNFRTGGVGFRCVQDIL